MAAKARRMGAVDDAERDESGVKVKEAKQFKVRPHTAPAAARNGGRCAAPAPCSPPPRSQVIVLGDGAVGKTSLCERFANDRFELKYKQVRSAGAGCQMKPSPSWRCADTRL